MAIDTELTLVIFVLSSIPFLILAMAEVQTVIYKRRILKRKVSHVSELPYLVRLHGTLVRRASINLLANVAMVVVLFGLPIAFVAILWPGDLFAFLSELQFWIIFWSVIVLCRVGCNSPDPTGNLGEAYELLDKDVL